MLARVNHHLRHLGLRNLVREYPTDALAAGMNLKHDASGVLAVQPEHVLQDIDDELHWRVVVVQQDHLVKGGALEFGGGLLEYQSSLDPRSLFAHGLIR